MRGPAVNVLHDKYNLRVGFNHVEQFGNVRVVYTLHNLDLSPNGLLPLQVLYLFLLINFESNFLISLLVESQENQSVGTLTNLLPNQIVVKIVVFRENYFFLGICNFFIGFCRNCSFLGLGA